MKQKHILIRNKFEENKWLHPKTNQSKAKATQKTTKNTHTKKRLKSFLSIIYCHRF